MKRYAAVMDQTLSAAAEAVAGAERPLRMTKAAPAARSITARPVSLTWVVGGDWHRLLPVNRSDGWHCSRARARPSRA